MPSLNELLAIMAKLRSPNGGCPWDLEQNFTTIAPYTIEEAYEVADAIARDDRNDLREELGDLLLQVVFHAQMAAEEGSFTFEDVARGICNKMIRRHPHVFGQAEIKTAQDQTTSWEAIKEQERLEKRKPSHEIPPMTQAAGGISGEGRSRTLAGIPAALPALMRAQKLQARAARARFDWPKVTDVIEKIHEELQEVTAAVRTENKSDIAEEIGDLLFAVTNLARFMDLDAESALRAANTKFTARFEYIEDALQASGKPLAQATLEEMDALWNEAKAREKQS